MYDNKTTILGIITTAAAGTAVLASGLALAAGIVTLIHGTKG
jgi:ethanolamine utilization microcompartment shell protein EutS